jgi:uncharacterized protein (TIGR02145 family)
MKRLPPLFLIFTFLCCANCNQSNTSKKVDTHKFGSIEDMRDFKKYKTIEIGNQVWMAENLNTNKFLNGDPIPEVKSIEDWEKAGENEEPAWCYLENNSYNGTLYGKLYNYFAVIDKRGLAPKGWHVPTWNEWNVLLDNLGGYKNAGEKLKNNTGWKDLKHYKDCQNCWDWNEEYKRKVPCHDCKDKREILYKKTPTAGTNSSGFSALPSSDRTYGEFDFMPQFQNLNCVFWSKTITYFGGYENYNKRILCLEIDHEHNISQGILQLGNGYAIRCIKD